MKNSRMFSQFVATIFADGYALGRASVPYRPRARLAAPSRVAAHTRQSVAGDSLLRQERRIREEET
jgi:hypothetical protein